MVLKAVLSTTVLPADGCYHVRTVELSDVARDIVGVPHYIGHPATKEIIEKLGAVPAASKLFEGQAVGEVVLACAIKQGRSKRTDASQTHQEVEISDLAFRLVTRIEP